MTDSPFWRRDPFAAAPPLPPVAPPMAAPPGYLGEYGGPAGSGYPPWVGPPVASPGPARAALVLAIIAIVIAVVTALISIAALGSSSSGDYAAADGDDDTVYLGTLPQATPQQPYPAARIESEVTWVLDSYYVDAHDVHCKPIPKLARSEATTCTAVLDDEDAELTLNLQDDIGHFSMTAF